MDIAVKVAFDPVGWVNTVLGEEPTKQQARALRGIQRQRWTTLRTKRGEGKTRGAAMCALYYLFSEPGTVVLLTAPSWHQVHHLLWPEFVRLLNGRRMDPVREMPPPPTLLFEPYRVGADWYADAPFAPDQWAERLKGITVQRGLIVMDEFPGVSDAFVNAAMDLPNVRFLATMSR